MHKNNLTSYLFSLLLYDEHNTKFVVFPSVFKHLLSTRQKQTLPGLRIKESGVFFSVKIKQSLVVFRCYCMLSFSPSLLPFLLFLNISWVLLSKKKNWQKSRYLRYYNILCLITARTPHGHVIRSNSGPGRWQSKLCMDDDHRA